MDSLINYLEIENKIKRKINIYFVNPKPKIIFLRIYNNISVNKFK